jgi:hypothetical protein
MVHLDLIRQPFNLLAEKSDGVTSTIAAGLGVWVIFHSCKLFSLSANPALIYPLLALV